VAYGAGLRATEVISLKVADIDSKRMIIGVEQGKGGKDRNVLLSPHLLDLLRAWWKASRPRGWLFPGRDTAQRMTTRQLNRTRRAAAQMAEINKRASLHTLRHSFATHRPWRLSDAGRRIRSAVSQAAGIETLHRMRH
jgi:integrase